MCYWLQVYNVDASTDSRTTPGDITSDDALHYMIVSSEPNDAAFQINPTTGQVTVAKSLVNTQFRRLFMIV